MNCVKMNSVFKGQLGALVLPALLLCLGCAAAQDSQGECSAKFESVREDFVLDADDSVKHGATFLSSPQLARNEDCVDTCCKTPSCNVAFLEKEAKQGSTNSCFLFDCVYKKKFVCRFVRKAGYTNYILDSVYESYLEENKVPSVSDRPPVANGGPDLVVQPHESFPLNGLESSDDVNIVSYDWKLLTNYPYAGIQKTNFNDQIIVSNLTSGVYKFQLTVTDNAGQTDSTKVTVLVLTPEQSGHHCMAPKKVGPCRGSFPRWHYNAASEQCEQFIFGGCRENLNNYLSKAECTNACYGSEKSGKSGRGLSVPELQEEKCGTTCTSQQFACANGCCLDPGLECDSTPQCSDGSDEQKCEDLNNKFQILRQIPVEEQKVRCTEHPDTGPCRETLTMWYYNPLKRECFRFNYGSCEGNENRFDTEESCKRVCHGVTETDVFARKEQFEHSVSDSQTGVTVIAVLLGLAIVILLGILLYCLMKGKKKSSQHHRVPVNTVPVTSMEDRERLVYNSTTKPI